MTGLGLRWVELAQVCAALVVLHAAGAVASAQETSAALETITGRVVEAGVEDYGVPGAVVRVEGTPLTATSDDMGAFVLEGVPALGPLVLIVEAPDYTTARLPLSAPERDQPLVLALVWANSDGAPPDATFSVNVVAVRGAPETASTVRITPRDIAAAPRRNAEEILRQVPGLTLVQHGSEGKGHQFFMRGFDATHGADLELTLDGLPINEWSNVHAQGYLDLAMIVPELVEEVVVTKGPFTLDQGAFGMAGSVEYRLGVPVEARGWRAAYTVGTTGRHRVFAGYAPLEDDASFAGAEVTHDDGFGVNRRLDRAAFNGRLRVLDLGKQGALSLTGVGAYSAFELPGTLRNDEVEAGLIDFYGAYDPLSEGRSGRGMVALDYTRRTEDHDVTLMAYGGYRRLELLENFTGFLLFPEDGDRRDQRQETWSYGGSATYNTRLVQELTLQTGLGWRGDVFAQRETNVGRDLETLAPRRDLEGVQQIVYGRAGLAWKPTEALRLDAGARLDIIRVDLTDLLADNAEGSGTLAVASPRVSAQWRALEALRLFAAYGRGFRPPEARAFSDFDPGQSGIGEDVFQGGEPAATVSDAFEVGARWDPVVWFGAQASGFATFIERESVFDHVSGVNVDLNGTQRLGGELVLFSEPVPWLSLSADLTLTDARFVESGNRVPLAPWLTSGGRMVLTHDSGLRAGLRVLVVAPRPLPHGATGATLVMTDATAGYTWRWLRLDVEVENFLDRRLREGEYHYASHWRPGQRPSAIPVLHTTAGAPRNMRVTLGAMF